MPTYAKKMRKTLESLIAALNVAFKELLSAQIEYSRGGGI
jgi:hypothetical protein